MTFDDIRLRDSSVRWQSVCWSPSPYSTHIECQTYSSCWPISHALNSLLSRYSSELEQQRIQNKGNQQAIYVTAVVVYYRREYNPHNMTSNLWHWPFSRKITSYSSKYSGCGTFYCPPSQVSMPTMICRRNERIFSSFDTWMFYCSSLGCRIWHFATVIQPTHWACGSVKQFISLLGVLQSGDAKRLDCSDENRMPEWTFYVQSIRAGRLAGSNVPMAVAITQQCLTIVRCRI